MYCKVRQVFLQSRTGIIIIPLSITKWDKYYKAEQCSLQSGTSIKVRQILHGNTIQQQIKKFI